MAAYNIYIAGTYRGDVGGWGLVLTASDNKELSHYIGTARASTQEEIDKHVLEQTHELINSSPDKRHTFTIIHKKNPEDVLEKLALGLAESALKFAAFNAIQVGGRKKVEVRDGDKKSTGGTNSGRK